MLKMIALTVFVLAACGTDKSASTPATTSPSHPVSTKLGAHATMSPPAAHACTPSKAGARCSDLLSQPVAPGTEGTQTVNLPAGMVLVDKSIKLTGDAVGRFTVESATSAAGSDAVELDVKFKNTSTDEVRFTADFSYALGSAGSGS